MTATLPPIGARVRMNSAGHARLGDNRKRGPEIRGTILGHVTVGSGANAHPRAQVQWDQPKYVETLRPMYLEEVQP